MSLPRSPIELKWSATPEQDGSEHKVPGASRLAREHLMAPLVRAGLDVEAAEQAEAAHKNAIADGLPCPPDCFWCEAKGRG